MHRQDHDVHFGIGRDDLAGRLDSIELRHRDVDDGDPGSQTENLCHGFAAVGRRSNDLHVRVRGQQRSQAIPQDSVIVGHEYRSTHRLPSTTLGTCGGVADAAGGQFNSTVTWVPSPGMDCSCSRAPIASARSRIVVVPIPYPPMIGLAPVSKPTPLSMMLNTTACSFCRKETEDSLARACFTMLFSASCAIRNNAISS